MNIRQQKYKQNRLLGMNIVNAARAAGYSEKYATHKGYRIERLVKVGLSDAFERAGLTDNAIIIHALEGLKADKVQGCDVYVYKDEDDKWQVNEAKNEFIENPDWNARHKYFETILKLTERLKDKWEVIGQQSIINIINTSGNKPNLINRLEGKPEAIPE